MKCARFKTFAQSNFTKRKRRRKQTKIRIKALNYPISEHEVTVGGARACRIAEHIASTLETNLKRAADSVADTTATRVIVPAPDGAQEINESLGVDGSLANLINLVGGSDTTSLSPARAKP